MPRKPSNSLDELDKKILATIREWVSKYHFPPTVREIKDAVGASSTSVVDYHIKKLTRLGLVQKLDSGRRRARNIMLIPTPHNPDATKPADFLEAMGAKQPLEAMAEEEAQLEVPVAGRIVAGAPMPSFADAFTPEDVVEVPASLLPKRSGRLYALEVKGNSMIDAMVQDGDIIVLEAVESANRGDMVAAWLRDRDEATLKYYIPDGKRVILRPANSAMEDIVVENPAELEIKGRVMLVIHRVDGSTCTYTVHRKCI